MENDDFVMTEESPAPRDAGITPDEHDEESRLLDDDELEKLFDEAEAEEGEQNQDDDKEKK